MCKDHLGNVFKSVHDMCTAYGIKEQSYHSLLRKGYSLQDILTGGYRTSYTVEDHLGNVFKSKTEMCRHYGVTVSEYDGRIKSGKSIEEALKAKEKIRDHLGNVYSSRNRMLMHYGITVDAYNNRIKRGWTLEKALTIPLKKRKCIPREDHLGNRYESLYEMLCHYNITRSAYEKRMEYGWSLEDILTKPLSGRMSAGRENNGAACSNSTGKVIDHLGREYATIDTMCKEYHILRQTYLARIGRGYSIEEALTTPVRHLSNRRAQ